MQGDDFGADREQLDAATKRLNSGEQIPQVEASWIEHIWGAMSRISREQKQQHAIGLTAIAGGDPDAPQISPEQRIALMTRFMLLDALIERGVVDEYMIDESQRKRVFAAAASINCDKNDLGEALAHRHLRELPPDAALKSKEELRLAGCDPDHAKIDGRFIEWIRDRC